MSTVMQPCCSPHSAISIAARYSSAGGTGLVSGARMSKRSMYMAGILAAGRSAVDRATRRPGSVGPGEVTGDGVAGPVILEGRLVLRALRVGSPGAGAGPASRGGGGGGGGHARVGGGA